MLILLLAACSACSGGGGGGGGADGPQPAEAQPAALGTPAASTTAGSATSSAIANSAPPSTHVTTPPTKEGLEAELEIVGEPDFVAVDEHGMWVRLAIGFVVLIDPATNEVVDRIEVQTEGFPCDGLGTGAGAVWTCTETELVRIDPDAHAVAWKVPVNKAALQGEMPVAENQVWVLEGDGSTLAGYDVETGARRSQFDLPARGTDLGFGEAGLWVVSSVDDAVLRVDPVTGSILDNVAVANPVDAWIDREVWIGAHDETVRIGVAGGTVDFSATVGTGPTGGIALTPAEAWVRDSEGMLTRIDRETGEIVEQYTSVLAGGDVAYGFGSVWTSAFDDSTVFRFAAPR